MDANERDVLVLPKEEAIERATSFFIEALAAVPGEITVCLTGGDDAQLIYEQLARKHLQRIPWDRVHWFWSDERFVPPDDEHSNFAMAKKSLLEPGGAPEGSIHRIPTTSFPSPMQASEHYDAEIARFRAKREAAGAPLFDLVIHGIGPDGHTASLYPGRPKDVNESRRLAIAVEMSEMPPFLPRISLTLPALNNSRAGLMLAVGEKKRDAVARALAGDDLPAAATRSNGRMIWILDEAAGAQA